SPYYEKSTAEATEATRAAYAKVIWYETAMGAPSINGQGTAATITGNSFTVTLADATKYGNALIGVYASQASDTPLWSYHIWHPDVANMEAALLTYDNTYSGTYKVMPLALGANKIPVLGETGTNGEYTSLFYMWGRKDPLGRTATVGGTAFVPVNGESSPTYFRTGAQVRNLKDCLLDPIAESKEPYWNEAESKFVLEVNGISIDRYMIEYTIAHPTQMFNPQTLSTTSWTIAANYYLWGNPQGYNYPKMGATYKSVFDPCPTGYRVAPADLWSNFGKMNPDNPSSMIANSNGTFNRGYAYYYDSGNTKTDVYPTQGYRSAAGNSIVSTSIAYYMSSAPTGAGATSFYRLRFDSSSVNIFHAFSDTVNGFHVRCVKEQ
ncbi:MAG: hypothetical protein K2K43_02555, partial [Alistipes sp.]|nr:hypothetical protein [Alistipes sp.]